MMRRILSAALLSAFLAAPALAQAPFAQIAPTPPTLDNGDRIATTAWVNNFINAGIPLASGKIFIGSVGNIATAQTITGDAALSVAGALTLSTVNANVGTFGSATQATIFTVDAKGRMTAAANVTVTPAVGSITGLGTGIATALGVNIGSAGAPVLFNGAGGTPSSIALASGTGLPISTGVSGLGAGCATWLGTPSSANLRGCITDESGTGLAYFQGGDIGTPSAGVGTNLTALNAGNLGSGNVPTARSAIVSAFSVNKNSVDQTGIVSATFTAVTWPTELYDINAHFASNGWTPDAGKVTMTASFFATGTITAGASAAIAIFKNGANYKQTSWGSATGAASATISTDDIANGSDVYTVQAFITTSAGTATITGNPGNTYFTGHWFSP